MRSPSSLLLASCTGALVVLVLLSITGAAETLERSSLDLRFGMRPAPGRPTPVTVIVLRGQREGAAARTPREELAHLFSDVSRLPSADRPAAMLVDLLLSGPDRCDDVMEGPAARVWRVGAETGIAVHAFQLAFRGIEQRGEEDHYEVLLKHTLPSAEAEPALRTAHGITLANAEFARELYSGAAGAGFTNLSPALRQARGDTIQSIPLLVRYTSALDNLAAPAAGVRRDSGLERNLLALSLAGAARAICGLKPLQECVRLEQEGIRLKGRVERFIPLDPSTGEYWINYRKRFRIALDLDREGATLQPGSPGRIPEVVFYHSSPGGTGRFLEQDGRREVQASELGREAWLIVDKLESNIAFTPLGAQFTQATTHAQIVTNILEDDLLRVLPGWAPWLASLVLLALVLAWRGIAPLPVTPWRYEGLPPRWRPLAYYLHSTLGSPEARVALCWVVAAIALFFAASIWVPVVLPCGALFGCILGRRIVFERHLSLAADRVTSLLTEKEQIVRELRASALRMQSLHAELRDTHQEAALQTELRQALEAQLKQVTALEGALEQQRAERDRRSAALTEIDERLEAGAASPEHAAAPPARGSSDGRQRWLQDERLRLVSELEASAGRILALQAALDHARSEAATHQDHLKRTENQLEARREELRVLEEMVGDVTELLAARLPGNAALLKLATTVSESRHLSERLAGLRDEMARLFRQAVRVSNELERQAPTAAKLEQWLERRRQAYLGMQEYARIMVTHTASLQQRLSPAGHDDDDLLTSLTPDQEVLSLTDCVTQDPELIRLMKQVVVRFAPSRQPVLIRGESGTGKELVARALHAYSRRSGSFEVINCAAVNEGTLESELFGYARGAHSEAKQSYPGRIGSAHRGTLFMDEVASMSLRMQEKLLRTLQDGEIHTMGSAGSHVDVRFIAATSRDLEQLVREGAFRPDLLFRIQGFIVQLPPLRERHGDIALLLKHFLADDAVNEGGKAGIDPEALALMEAYPWPGNVRELQRVFSSLTLESEGHRITASDVRRRLRRPMELTGDLAARQAPGGQGPADLPDAAAQRGDGHVTPFPPGGVPLEPTPEPAQGKTFGGRDLELLTIFRRHAFNPVTCWKDPAYPGKRETGKRSRATAYNDLNVLLSKALRLAGWRIDATVLLLAGSDPALEDPVRSRIEALLVHARSLQAELSEAGLLQAYQRYRRDRVHMVAVAQALRDELIR